MAKAPVVISLTPEQRALIRQASGNDLTELTVGQVTTASGWLFQAGGEELWLLKPARKSRLIIVFAGRSPWPYADVGRRIAAEPSILTPRSSSARSSGMKIAKMNEWKSRSSKSS